MGIERTESLELARLVSGDGPSLRVVGLYAAQSLKQAGVAVFMVDVLGRVHVMPPGAVQGVVRPRVLTEDLDLLDESEAIVALVTQGDSEDQIIEYLRGRKERLNG